MNEQRPGSYIQSLKTKWKILLETCMMLNHNNRFVSFDKFLEG